MNFLKQKNRIGKKKGEERANQTDILPDRRSKKREKKNGKKYNTSYSSKTFKPFDFFLSFFSIRQFTIPLEFAYKYLHILLLKRKKHFSAPIMV